jgi:hypothetical protein
MGDGLPRSWDFRRQVDEKRPTLRFECLTIHLSDMPTSRSCGLCERRISGVIGATVSRDRFKIGQFRVLLCPDGQGLALSGPSEPPRMKQRGKVHEWRRLGA